VFADSRIARLVTDQDGDEKVNWPTPRTIAATSPVDGVAKKSSDTLPPDHSPVGTRTAWPAGSDGDVMSTTSATGVSTLMPTMLAWKLPSEPANVKVAP
jgi:hypothetical protein